MKIINKNIPEILLKLVREVNVICENKDAKVIFEKCLLNGYQTTFEYENGYTFVLTGDIDAMWFRDSTCQMIPYLKMIKYSDEIKNMCRGLIETHKKQFIIDVYANAFNKKGARPEHRLKFENIGVSQDVWERKFELDSICYPLDFLYRYIQITNDHSILDNEFIEVLKIITQLLKIEQDHFKNSMYRFYTLENYGIGKPVNSIGLIWSSHRPSDDEQKYGYLIPSNLYLVKCLKQIYSLQKYIDYDLNELSIIANQVLNAVNEYGIIIHPVYGKIYAYEVDGLGNYNLMDDANMPSLLSMQYLNQDYINVEVYRNTRKFILSKNNPYYYSGQYASGIGSPHTNENEVWHIALCMQYLTENNNEAKKDIFNMLCTTHAKTFLMHEAFNVDNPKIYSREWFGWANAMFIEVMFDKYQLLKGDKL